MENPLEVWTEFKSDGNMLGLKMLAVLYSFLWTKSDLGQMIKSALKLWWWWSSNSEVMKLFLKSCVAQKLWYNNRARRKLYISWRLTVQCPVSLQFSSADLCKYFPRRKWLDKLPSEDFKVQQNDTSQLAEVHCGDIGFHKYFYSVVARAQSTVVSESF